MIFVPVILVIVVIFTSGASNGVRGCEMFVPFSKNTVALAGVFVTVVFVTFKAVAEVTTLDVYNKASVIPAKIKK